MPTVLLSLYTKLPPSTTTVATAPVNRISFHLLDKVVVEELAAEACAARLTGARVDRGLL